VSDATAERIRPLYVAIATALEALQGCRRDNANESQRSWESKWEAFIVRASCELPRGSGFDSYPAIDTDDIKANRITITGSYHCMDADGYYCGWTDYTVTVKPSLTNGFTMRIVGGDSDFKDYVHECFDIALRQEFPESAFYELPVKA
jgi:hypothetical protein